MAIVMHGRAQKTLSEINVTPLVDVMLVLLIVFMITAPLMQQGVQVELPKAAATPLDQQQDQVILVITSDQRIMINENDILPKDLKSKLAAIYANKSTREIYVQADENVSYGFVARVMAELKRAGITKVGLVTEPPDSAHKLKK
jgi:biopolymer transport protein TolR